MLYQSIKYLFPDAEPRRDFTLQDDGAGPYIAQWNLDAPRPSNEELTQAWEAYQAQQAATEYQRLRAAAYDEQLPIGEQLDALRKGFAALAAQGYDIGPMQAVIDTATAIKTANPKE